MGRIADAFTRASADNRAALVIYICAGDPNLRATEDLVVAAAEAGADVITTNTYGVICSDLAREGVGHRFEELNQLACTLACEV